MDWLHFCFSILLLSVRVQCFACLVAGALNEEREGKKREEDGVLRNNRRAIRGVKYHIPAGCNMLYPPQILALIRAHLRARAFRPVRSLFFLIHGASSFLWKILYMLDPLPENSPVPVLDVRYAYRTSRIRKKLFFSPISDTGRRKNPVSEFNLIVRIPDVPYGYRTLFRPKSEILPT